MTRFIFISWLAVAAALGSTAARAEEVSSEALVDGLNAVFGKNPGRASHPKGLCVQGNFKPAAAAADYSKAAFLAKEVPVLARFSIGGGNPKAADNARGTRGLAIRFDPDSKQPSDLVTLSVPIFFARTPEQVLGFFGARVPAADGKPDPEKVKAFAEANPDTKRQGAWVASHPIPASYASTSYWGIHAFTLTNAKGEAKIVKWRLVPADGEVGLSDDEAKAKPADFLFDDLQQHFSTRPVTFEVRAILGQEGDPVDDPTALWPEEQRTAVGLGTLSISAVAPAAACDAITFDPTNLADGIEGPKNDKIFAARPGAYAVSLSRRLTTGSR